MTYGYNGTHASVRLHCSFSAASVLLQCCGHAASSSGLALHGSIVVMLILPVLQPPSVETGVKQRCSLKALTCSMAAVLCRFGG